VNSIEDTVKLYTDGLGLEVEEIEILEQEKVKTAMIPVGESKIELIESTDSEGQIAKYIKKKGEGIHHLALEVQDIRHMLKTLKEKNIPLINEQPRVGVGGSKIAFLHPKETKALIELVEH
jgi:methylmalonyl-CoA epimerase